MRVSSPVFLPYKAISGFHFMSYFTRLVIRFGWTCTCSGVTGSFGFYYSQHAMQIFHMKSRLESGNCELFGYYRTFTHEPHLNRLSCLFVRTLCLCSCISINIVFLRRLCYLGMHLLMYMYSYLYQKVVLWLLNHGLLFPWARNFNLNCLVLVGSRNGFDRDLHHQRVLVSKSNWRK